MFCPQNNWQNYKGKSEHKTDVPCCLTQWDKTLRKQLRILGICSLLVSKRNIHYEDYIHQIKQSFFTYNALIKLNEIIQDKCMK